MRKKVENREFVECEGKPREKNAMSYTNII